MGVLSTAGAFAQTQECVCRAQGSDKAFQLPATSACKADCESKGAFNVQACQLLTKTDGDCKGHIPSVCGIIVQLRGEGVNAHLIMKNNYKEQPVAVGESVEFRVQGAPKLIGDGGVHDAQIGLNGGPRPCTLRSSCEIRYGDGETGKCDVAGFPVPTHKYSKPGIYVATVEAITTCERGATSTSCGFTISSGVVEAPIKVVA